MPPHFLSPAPDTPNLAHRAAAAAAAALLLALAAVALGHADQAMPELPGFQPAVSAATGIVHLVTAALLLGQGAAGGAGGAVRLGAAYLFAAVLIFAQLACLPGVFASAPLLGGSGTPVWLWSAWHGGFALLVVRYATTPVRSRRPRPGEAVAGVLAAAAVAVLAATAGLPWPPAVAEGRSYAAMAQLGAMPAVVLANAAALLLVVRRLRAGGTVDLWLCVAMLAATLDTGLTTLGEARFSLGWHLGRLGSLLAALLVLLALLRDVAAMYRRAAAENVTLANLAECDPMTGLANRRRFDRLLALEWRRAQREGWPLALVMLDVDCFKQFNDRYGHPAGDLCLKRLAVILAEATRRSGDLAVRMGGEEFALLLPNTGPAGAAAIVSAVRDELDRAGIPHEAGVRDVVTVSAGISVSRPGTADLNPGALVEAADRALYGAKAAGRDRTVIVEPAAVG